MANHEMSIPEECAKCIKAVAAGTFNKTSQEAMHCLAIASCPIEALDTLPCAGLTNIGGAGNFQNLNEDEFNNRGDQDPSGHIPHGKYVG